MVLGPAELCPRLDVLAGHRLLYVAEVRRRGDGTWLVERADLSRETYQRVESLIVPAAEADRLPRPERLYLQARAGAVEAAAPVWLLHPLLIYDGDAPGGLFPNPPPGHAHVA